MVERDEQPSPDLRDRIVDMSVEVSEEVEWKNLRLHTVAQRLGSGYAGIERSPGTSTPSSWPGS